MIKLYKTKERKLVFLVNVLNLLKYRGFVFKIQFLRINT